MPDIHRPAGTRSDPPLPVASPSDLGFDPGRLDRLRECLQAEVAREAIPGAVVLVARHGHVAWHAAFGSAEPGAPMQADTLFRLAAMTRPIVAATALALAEEGRLALADPVAHYLPEFAAVQVGVAQDGRLVLEPPRRAMSVHDLMRHTSGLTYGMFGDSPVQRLYREAGVMDPAQTNAEMVGRLARLPLQCHPASQFEYGMSTDVLGRVIEVAAGDTLDAVVASRITGPLGMRSTGFRVTPGAAGLARPRTPTAILFDHDPARPPTWCSGGAGLLGTAADYARFLQMMLGGGALHGVRVLSPATVALMLADHLPAGIAFGTSTPALGINAPLPELGQGHGLGVGVRCRDGLAPVPGSVGDFFWGGALGTYFWADPKLQLQCVLMLQETDPQARARPRAVLRHAIYGALIRPEQA